MKQNFGKKRILFFVAPLLVAFSLVGCGAANYDYGYTTAAGDAARSPQSAYVTDTAVDDFYYEGEADYAAVENAETGGGDAWDMDDAMVVEPEVPEIDSIGGAEEQKIIKNASLHLQTRTFDESVERVYDIAADFGGYIQDSYVEGQNLYDEYGVRTANFTMRVPAERLEDLIASLGEEFNILSKQEYTDNVTGQYYDVETRMRSLKIQEERLLELLAQEGDLEYLFQVERELAYVTYQIESFQTTLNSLDNQVNYSTVSLYVEEVYEYTPTESQAVAFGDKAGRALRNSWEGFKRFLESCALAAIALLPFLPLIAIVVAVVVIVLRRIIKNFLAGRPLMSKPPKKDRTKTSAPKDGKKDEKTE